jgi:precorrin-2 dehydrogenase / sirohydrochlorin ferrochelatase
MPFGFPVFLELSGRRAVVIGAQAVAEGKAAALAAAGAEVTLLTSGGWCPADLEGAFVCVASSDDPAERDAIARAARDRGVLINVMDDVPNCDFAAPAVVRRGELVVAISTGGRSPALARRLREELETQFGEEWAEVLEVLREVREETLPLLPELAERSRRWNEALNPREAAVLVASGRRDELKANLRGRLLDQEVEA